MDYHDSLPMGGIHTFRKNLFAEHLGQPHPLFTDPGTENCARYVREMGLKNWKDYQSVAPDHIPQGHLLSYPVDISVSVHENVPIVTLHARTKKGKFLDRRAKISGQGSKSIPNKLTT